IPPDPELLPGDAHEKFDNLDRIMLRGQIDAMIRTARGLVVIDYKTDRITARTLEKRVEFYRPQVKAYCQAISAITGLPVESAHMVFFAVRRIVTI
ncbi:MAG: PD-(D/E)XK nuclease family protein, partial [Phycisphaerales bacterium]|nr:PD-(D/E)XK nuclease family protein [Phycisphaerales bacterium]